MQKSAALQLENSKIWLIREALPLWSSAGVDTRTGAFVECLSFAGEAQSLPRRAMVQARQIYSFAVAYQMQGLDRELAKSIVERGATHLVRSYGLSSGAFVHSVDLEGRHANLEPDLYSQAFVLFGLANAYALVPRDEYKQCAFRLLDYLRRERQAPQGGFTEIKGGQTLYQSNPHMHLFEAALAWLKLEPTDSAWHALVKEIATLAQTKFIDRGTGLLAEHFDQSWMPLREQGHFVVEPGHQYEWSWLFSVYDELTGSNTRAVRGKLFQMAEDYGLSQPEGLALDELWSNLSVKKRSSRFWPQGERIKAALRLGLEHPRHDQPRFAAAADQALQALGKYLPQAHPGLWYDTLLETGEFNNQAPKASSLYHIINAISEYVTLRPRLLD